MGTLVDVDEAARMLGVSVWGVYHLRRRGRLRAFRVAGGGRRRLRFRVSDLQALAAERADAAERRAVALRLLADETLSGHEIARRSGLSFQTVCGWRRRRAP